MHCKKYLLYNGASAAFHEGFDEDTHHVLVQLRPILPLLPRNKKIRTAAIKQTHCHWKKDEIKLPIVLYAEWTSKRKQAFKDIPF